MPTGQRTRAQCEAVSYYSGLAVARRWASGTRYAEREAASPVQSSTGARRPSCSHPTPSALWRPECCCRSVRRQWPWPYQPVQDLVQDQVGYTPARRSNGEWYLTWASSFRASSIQCLQPHRAGPQQANVLDGRRRTSSLDVGGLGRNNLTRPSGRSAYWPTHQRSARRHAGHTRTVGSYGPTRQPWTTFVLCFIEHPAKAGRGWLRRGHAWVKIKTCRPVPIGSEDEIQNNWWAWAGLGLGRVE